MNIEELPQEDIVDIEVYAKAGKPIPRAQGYRIRIDKETFVVKTPSLTGRQLLELAGKTPVEQFNIFQKVKGGGQPQKIELDAKADFTAPGVERFVTLPLDQTEGDGVEPCRHFALSEEDVEYLDSLQLPWETVAEANVRRVVIRQFPLVEGYNAGKADIHFRLETAYPDAQIDMVYFCPVLARADGKAINGLSTCTFDGRSWQQWSRHRTAENPWRSGVDNLSTHVPLVTEWLRQEFKKR